METKETKINGIKVFVDGIQIGSISKLEISEKKIYNKIKELPKMDSDLDLLPGKIEFSANHNNKIPV